VDLDIRNLRGARASWSWTPRSLLLCLLSPHFNQSSKQKTRDVTSRVFKGLSAFPQNCTNSVHSILDRSTHLPLILAENHKLFGASPNCCFNFAIASLSSDSQSSLRLWCICEYGEVCSSNHRYVATRSVGGSLCVVPAKSMHSDPLSQPRGVRCHSVHSLLKDTGLSFRGKLSRSVTTLSNTSENLPPYHPRQVLRLVHGNSLMGSGQRHAIPQSLGNGRSASTIVHKCQPRPS